MIPPFVTIKKIDGSKLALNLNRVVSVEPIPNNGDPYYMVMDTNGRMHLVDEDPLATKAHVNGMKYTIKE